MTAFLDLFRQLPCTFAVRWAAAFVLLPMALQAEDKIAPRGDLLLLIGSSGEEEYLKQFGDWSEKWTAAAQAGHVTVHRVGGDKQPQALSEFQAALKSLSEEKRLPLWIVLIGHGTFDGKTALFNLSGPDLDPAALKDCLQHCTRPVCVINCSSASAPFLSILAASNRVVVTATNSGNEVNFARFGGYLASSINDLAADLDKDEQVSLLEAFLRASRLTEDFYEGEGRLPTEHALIDDNGDARPVPLSGFNGLEPIQRMESADRLSDGMVAHQWHLIASEANAALPPEVLARSNELELQIMKLRAQKRGIAETEYYSRLEDLVLEMARLLVPVAKDDVKQNSTD